VTRTEKTNRLKTLLNRLRTETDLKSLAKPPQ
jgi:hypothetical protein